MLFPGDLPQRRQARPFPACLKSMASALASTAKARAMDNIIVKRLWRSLKYEDIYLKDYETVQETLDGLRTYSQFYNNERAHQSFGGKTSAEVYWGEETFKKAA